MLSGPFNHFIKLLLLIAWKAKRKQLRQNNRELWDCSWNEASLAVLWYEVCSKEKTTQLKNSHTQNSRSGWGVYKPWRPPALSTKLIDWWIRGKAMMLYWFHLLNPHEPWREDEDVIDGRHPLKKRQLRAVQRSIAAQYLEGGGTSILHTPSML